MSLSSGIDHRTTRELLAAMLLCLITLCPCANFTIASSQQPDIQVDVTLVRVPFVAVDGNGKPIHDIGREELMLMEDGSPQEIKYLWTESDLPLTVGLVIDISSSQQGLVGKHREAVERFINRMMGPADHALLATVDEQPRLLVDLTASPAKLLGGAELVRQQRHAGELFGEPCQHPARSDCAGTAIWDGVFHVARSILLRATGRKALVLLSDGLDLNSSVHGLSSAIEASQSAGVTVYTIKYLSAPYLAISPPLLVVALRGRGMERIATQTGGLAFKNPKDLDKVYGQIEEDLRSQYVLAYRPKGAPVSGAWHRLEIQTTRAGVKVRAQTGYRVP